MGRGPAKAKAKAKLPVAAKTRKDKRLGEALKREAEAVEQQAATAEILGIISRSPADAQPVFDAIAVNALRLCHAAGATVWRYDGTLLHLAAHHNVSPEAVALLKRRPPLAPDRHLPVGRAVLDAAVVHVPDLQAAVEFSAMVARRVGARSYVAIPLLHQGRALGAIGISRRTLGPFSDRQIALLQTFAEQAVIAIENARLLKEVQARNADLADALEQQTATSEILGVISSSPTDVQPVFDVIVQSAVRLCGGLHSNVYRVEDGLIHLVAHHNFSPAALEDLQRRFPVPVSQAEGLAARVIREGIPVHLRDAQTDPEAPETTRRITRALGARSVLYVPMLRDRVGIGVIVVSRGELKPFSDKEIALIRTFADQAVIAIENVRLFRELEQKSRELETTSQHKSEFLANMSHELRTPLNAVIGFSDALLDRMFGEMNEKQEEYLRDIRDSGGHLLSLINDILDLSKVEAGQMELELTDFDLPQAIQNALILVRERATRRGIALHEVIGERIGHIRADERKVKQVLLNLLSNAIKFTPEGGRIDVTAAWVDGAVEIAVTDTGIGIAPEDQQAVFEEFRQVGGADQKAEGTGLGLTLCRKFVELHGGRIGVRSEVGRGSTFTFTLPVGP